MQLPKNFLFGAASAAHQVEGNNINSNWWHEEQLGKLPKSGLATNHYNEFGEDFVLAKQIGLNALRISVEWSRIEPKENEWNMEEVEHYHEVLQKMKELGLTRMVTLFHFTLPQWAAKLGGLESKYVVERFAKFSKFVAENLGHEIDLWITINEPEVYTLLGYFRGVHPPFKKSLWTSVKVVQNLITAHNQSYLAIKSALPSAKIGMAKNNVYYEPYRAKNLLDRGLVALLKYFGNHYILNRTISHCDFIGLNYYFYQNIKFSWASGGVLKNAERIKSVMGLKTYPKGLYFLLRDLAKYKKPIYITENGIANANDEMRQRFIKEHLEAVSLAVKERIDVRGYFNWSLTDTFEWHDGYGLKFGLIEINFETGERKIRPGAEVFNKVIKNI